MIFKLPITISLSPNTEQDDVRLAFSVLLKPHMWIEGNAKQQLITWFKNTFNTSNIFLFNSGRSALYCLLKAFEIGKDDEVIVQSFTCVAVPNSVLWNGATPIYADVDESYNLNLQTIKKVTTKKTKAIIVQHTFGIAAEIDEIVSWAKERKIVLIEDCAHSLGAMYKNKLLGSWGDAAFFSFGRDKVVSSVFGGVGIVSEKHDEVAKKLKDICKLLPHSRLFWIFQQLFHPIAFSLILPLYLVGLGKFLLFLFQKLSLLSFPVYPEEKKGKQPVDFPAQYSNALATLAVHQLKKLDRYNNMRRKAAKYYRDTLKNVAMPPERDGSIYLRFPILVKNPKKTLLESKERGMLLGNWYQSVIDPKGTDFSKIQYTFGKTPEAEKLSKQVINLPTRISEMDVQLIVNVVQSSI